MRMRHAPCAGLLAGATTLGAAAAPAAAIGRATGTIELTVTDPINQPISGREICPTTKMHGAFKAGTGAMCAPPLSDKRGRDGLMRPVGRPLSPRMVSRVFRRYAERAGLPDSIRLHDLRHTAITNAIGQGEDILLVAAFAGHANTSTMVDVYSHLLLKRAHESSRRMRSLAQSPTQAIGYDGGGAS